MKISLIADVLLIAEDKVLMVKYKDKNKYDHQSGWFLPDDLIKEFNHPDDEAIRILNEQLGLSNINPKLDHIESFKGNDKSWHLVFHYKAILPNAPDITKSDEVEEFKWFDLKNLPDKNEVAHHGWALHTIREMLKVKS